MSSDSELSFGWVETDDNEELTVDDIDNMGTDTHTNDIVVKTEPADDSSDDEISMRKSISNGTSRHRNSEVSFQNNVKMNNKLEDFLKENPKLINAVSSNVNEIDSDDEVWLVQCPYNFNTKSIIGTPLINNEKSKIKIPGTKFEWVTVEKDKDERITTLMPATKHKGCVISSIPVKGKIIIRERMKTSHVPHISEELESKVPFPSNLKIRHPLFGIDYRKEIELSEEIRQKLKESPKKKKKSSEINVSEVDGGSKKDKSSKKKRKANVLEDEIINPPKKIKKEKNSWENETSIEMNLFDLPKKKMKK